MNKKIIKFVSVFLILCLINPLPAFAANDELDSKNNSALSSTAQSLLPATSAMLPAISKDLYEQYVLGPGVSLTVNIIVGRNSLNQRFDITLSFDGKAFFPSIGAMDLNGIKLKDAEKVIGKQLSRYFKEAFVINVKLSGVKSINVYATGNVLRPGGSTVAYGTRLSQFIAAAGIAGGGSARTVFVSRRGSKHSFDMMAPMLNGDFKQDIFLEPDDIVEIPIVENNRVTIMGGISRPGMYEMKKGEKLSDLLKIAGYSTVNSALSSAVLLKRVFDKENFVQLVENSGLIVERYDTWGFYWTVFMSLFWVVHQKECFDGAVLDCIKPPYHHVLQSWSNTWAGLMELKGSEKLLESFDKYLPKTQVIIARKQ